MGRVGLTHLQCSLFDARSHLFIIHLQNLVEEYQSNFDSFASNLNQCVLNVDDSTWNFEDFATNLDEYTANYCELISSDRRISFNGFLSLNL